MKMKKLSLVLAMLLLLITVFPVQAEEQQLGPDGRGNDSSGGVDASTWSLVLPGAGTVSGGDAIDDLSGKTVNLAFVIDTTGSMSSYINGVVKNLSEFVHYIESTGANLRLALIDYRDIVAGEETVVHTFEHSVWSQSTEQLIEEMQALYATGGGDYPETLLDALGYLVDESVMTFNSDAAKFAIVLTDATYKLDNNHGIESMDEMITALQEKGIKVSVMTNSYCYDDYEALTTSTGGILCPVNNFSATLMEYATAIIRAAADAEVDGSIRPVTGITATGPAAIRPDYVYAYHVAFEPEDATNKGVYWYTENEEIAEVISAKGTNCYVRGVSEGNTRLVAVSSDGGYTSAVDIMISNTAAISDSVLTYEYAIVKDALEIDSVKTIEYRVTSDAGLAAEQQREVFSAIKGEEKTFSFAYTDGEKSVVYKWSFQGEKITDENQFVDFGIVPDAGNKEVLGAVVEDVAKMDIHFNHNGSLPGEAIVSVPVKDNFSTDSLYLYYYNAGTGALEPAAEGVPVIDGYAVFPLSHCSDYILTAEMLRSLVPDLGGDDDDADEAESIVQTVDTAEAALKAPKTGDKDMTMVIAVFAFAAAGAAVCGKMLWSAKKNKK